MISTTRFWFFIGSIILVYFFGLFVPLFEYDSAQFAVMAMRMVQENDFVSLFKGPQEYLDKPHMHFWLAAIFFKIFGIHAWVYRLPGIFAILLGGYSCFGLGKLLYNEEVGKIAALIFLTCQTIVLAAIDVRTDAVLTGFTILAIWQLATYVEKGTIGNIILGAFGAGMAFSTKGQIALVVIGISMLCHLAYTRKWKKLLNWKVLIALAVFGITITPMLYAYYQQFDLHPEKVIRGKNNRSGIFFIFWEQSFERLSGEGHGKNSSDYFFFFHTFLWVFLPWTVMALLAIYTRSRTFMQNQFRFNPKKEFLTLGGIVIAFILISFAQFKLPHYLNILMPLYAVLTASYLYKARANIAFVKVLLGIQFGILSLVYTAVLLICIYVFPLKGFFSYLALILVLGAVAYHCFRREKNMVKLISIACCTAILLNGVLNTHFYPSLLDYQGGSTMADRVEEERIPVDRIYKVSDKASWALDFYNKKPVQITTARELKKMSDVWVYADDAELETLKNEGFNWDAQITVDHFRITRLSLKFLNKNKRSRTLRSRHLIHLN